MSLPVAILAGGLATRLRPITEKIPKALVEVAGRPFIEWQLDYLQQQGIRHVVLCVGYLGEQIQEVVGDGGKYRVHVDYSFDGPKLLGTGGALKQALHLLGEDFFIFYGDSYLPVDFRAVGQDYVKQGKPALMTVLKNLDKWDTSNVVFRDGTLIEYDKRQKNSEMNYIDYGLGVVNVSVFKGTPDNESFDLADIYHRLSVQGQLAGFEVFERFYEIGSHQGLKETAEYLEKNCK